ncbi:hypothetical protein ACROYT_G036933 [Oculina patagonica]
MKNGKIPDSAITASSSYSQYHGPERARLDTMRSGSYVGAWIPKSQNGGQWIQVDLGKITKITRLATQGRQNAKQWVKSYSITYSVDGGLFLPYHDNQVLTGNKDSNTIVVHILNPPIIARYIRIHPKEYHGYMALRFELYGCTEGFEPPKLECQSDLGMKNGKIPDSAITASSSYSQHHGPERARLDTVRSGRYVGAWIPQSQNGGQWIQVDLGKITKITRLATQGRQDAKQWVKSYSITYSVGGGIFLPYNDNQVLPGNKDSNTIVGHILDPPIVARYIRIHPKEYQGYMALRFELYGCTDGFEPPKLECQSVLGMKNGKIPSAITASSSYSQHHGPERARLDTVRSGSYVGAWIPQSQSGGQWIQVDLRKITKITRLATQGRQDVKQWVKSYSITYSVDGGLFRPYNDNQVLSGNKDSNTIVVHILNPPIIARYIRIHPKEYHGYMALRFELYGCTEEPYTSVTKHSPEFRIPSQITHSSAVIDHHAKSFWFSNNETFKLKVVAEEETVQNNCKIAREYGMIPNDSVHLQFVAIRQVASEKIKQIQRVNFKCHQNETCAVTSICREFSIQSNSSEVVSFSREVVVF